MGLNLHMKSFIFITCEGYTFQPDSECAEPDIENCQVVGFAKGTDAQEAFRNLVCENDYLLQTSFDELICFELKQSDHFKHREYFRLEDCARDGFRVSEDAV